MIGHPTALGLGTAALALLAACTDPGANACANANRDITLVNLAGNSLSGSYANCVADLEGELAALRLESRRLSAEAARLEAQAARLDGERRSAAQRLSQITARQAELSQQIADTDAGRSGLGDLVSRDAALRAEIDRAAANDGVDEATANRLLEQQLQLNTLARQIL
ncbi:hypothetical protein [uncultured Limimaricola sp.]|uniref:hypothetical protein n=1 Tax=uncultured Limimaricola sp. TaxID=2211667 RepID=UPI0030FC537A